LQFKLQFLFWMRQIQSVLQCPTQEQNDAFLGYIHESPQFNSKSILNQSPPISHYIPSSLNREYWLNIDETIVKTYDSFYEHLLKYENLKGDRVHQLHLKYADVLYLAVKGMQLESW